MCVVTVRRRSRRAQTALRICALVAALHVCAHRCAWADDPAPDTEYAYTVRAWGPASGLVQGTVNGLVRGRSGYVWLATYGGLVRFDGLRFTTYDLNSILTLKTMRVSAIAASQDRGVWIGTTAREVLHVFGDQIRDGPPPLPGPARPVTALAVSADGVLHAYADGLFVLVGNRWITVETAGVGRNARLLAGRSTVWVGGDEGLAGERDRVLTVERGGGPEAAPGRRPLFEDGRARLWLGTTRGLLVRYPDGRIVQPEGGDSIGAEPTAALIDDRERLWVAAGSQVHVFSLSETENRVRLSPVYFRDSGAPGRGITALLSVGGGGVLAGTDGDGLFSFAPQEHVTLDARHGLPPARVNHVVSDGQGGLWAAADCTGVTHLAGPALRRDDRGRVALVDHCVRSLYVDRDNALWIGQAGAVARIASDGAFRQWDLRPELSTSGIAAITEARDGSIWIGTANGCVLRLDRTGSFRAPVPCNATPRDPVSALAGAPDGSMWVGQIGTVSRIKGTAVFTYDAADGVPQGEVRGLQVNEDGTLWIGAYGGGLTRIRGTAVVRLREPTLAGSAISGYLDDGRGYVWLLRNRGVFVVRTDRLDAVADGATPDAEAVMLGEVRGIPEGIGGSPAATLLTDGRAAFAAADGVALFDTRAFPFDRTPLDARIEFEEEQHESTDGPMEQTLEGNALTVRFTAVTFAHPDRVQFRYRLLGRETDWVRAGQERAARYSGLQPGAYRFEVAARSEYGVWSTRPATMAITVPPAWWQTWWARLAALGVALLAAMTAVQLRVGFVRRQGREVQRRVEDQLDAEARARRLERQLARVTSAATAGELATVIAHELNQPLAAIAANAEAGRRLLAMPQPAAYEMADVLQDIANDGRRAVEVVRALRGLVTRGDRNETAVDLADVVRTVVALVKRDLNDAAIVLSAELAEPLPAVRGDRVLLQQLVLNVVNNAADSVRVLSDARAIEIRARARGAWVRVSVRDSGPGISRLALRRVFEPFYTTKPEGMGMGLSISRSIVEAHGGRLRAYNSPAGGAVFAVMLPRWKP